jgi:hypothetical protein
MKTPITLLALAALVTTGFSQNCDPDPMAAVGAAMIVGGQGGSPALINDNGRNGFVVGDGKGSGVIYQDRGPTYIQKVGGSTFIVPTANPPAGQRNRQRNY